MVVPITIGRGASSGFAYAIGLVAWAAGIGAAMHAVACAREGVDVLHDVKLADVLRVESVLL